MSLRTAKLAAELVQRTLRSKLIDRASVVVGPQAAPATARGLPALTLPLVSAPRRLTGVGPCLTDRRH